MEELMNCAWARQQDEIERIRMENPSLLERGVSVDPDMLLAHVGIVGLSANRPRGYIRYRPQDFVVEEICHDGSICSVRPTRSEPDDHVGDRGVLHCNMMKEGISTITALKNLREVLDLDDDQVGYAEAKDANAITSQRISLRGVDWKNVVGKEVQQVSLEPICYGGDVVRGGELAGNRFTILVRSDGTDSNDKLKQLIDRQGERGFLNFFAPHSFGARKISHKLGCLLARGDFESCLRVFFTEKGIDDLPVFRQTRDRLSATYGDWRAMKEIVEKFPHTFALEIKVLGSLADEPKKTINAIRAVRSDARNWLRSYNHWVVNRYLSKARHDLETLPERIPLPLHDVGHYRDELAMDEIVGMEHLESFGLREPRGEIISIVRPSIHRVIKIKEGAVFSFSLPSKADPFVCLSNIYKLHSGSPVPGWVV